MSQPLISIPSQEGLPLPSAISLGQEKKVERLWLAAYLPQLPLTALGKSECSPYVVVEREGADWRIAAANAGALAVGVAVGASLREVLAVYGALEYCERSPAREQRTLEALSAWSMRLTPVVSWVPYDALLLEVGGSLRLLGGLGPIKTRLAEELKRRDLAFKLATAPTRLGALWLARYGGTDALDSTALRRHLSELPIAVTRWPANVQALLRGAGIQALGECFRLPRDGLTLRCGKQVMQDLDRALGRSPDPVEPFTPRQWLSYEVDFIAGLTAPAELVAATESLIDALAGELSERQALARKLEILLRHHGGRDVKQVIELLDPSRDKARLSRLVLCRIQKLKLDESIIAMRCRAKIEYPTRAIHPSLFEPKSQSAMTLPELIELLRERLGIENVHGLSALPDYRPEKAWRARRDAVAVTDEAEMPPGSCRRPLWLLSSPRAVKGLEGIRLESGPERIETGWWDGGEARRDYYVARTTHESAWWIYREHESGRWYLHGLFG